MGEKRFIITEGQLDYIRNNRIKDYKASNVYEAVFDVLFDEIERQGLPAKIANEVERRNPNISNAGARKLLENVINGLRIMSRDSKRIDGFERLLKSLGVKQDADLLTKDNNID